MPRAIPKEREQTLPKWAQDELSRLRDASKEHRRHVYVGAFTDAEIGIIRNDFTAWVPVPEIAVKLGRTYESVRGQIFRMRLHRSQPVMHRLRNAPPHVRAVLFNKGESAFIAAHATWRREKQFEILGRHAKHAIVEAQCDIIAADITLTREQQMLAMRKLGATLETIGSRYNLTRQRIQQLCPDIEHPKSVIKPRIEA